MYDVNKDYNIFAGPKFIESLRSGGYRDTSYAVGEIVDNSIDANAKHVEIMCLDKISHSTNRRSLEKIAILDDGDGMNMVELRNSLLFGDGTRGSNPKDIGKYGMGLPNSSLSQCKRVEVYSWQNFSEPLYCYIDVDEVKNGKKEVPEPKKEKLPSTWRQAANHFSKQSGTLVVWNKLDRCSWTTSKKIMEHSQFLIGRIYRKFLADRSIQIHMTTFMVSDNEDVTEQKSTPMLPNDPMYLIKPSSTPGKWGKEAMFQRDTNYEKRYPIHYNGEKHEITVRYSIEKDELRDPKYVQGDQGNTKHGQHARKNEGISIMRAGREIVLDRFGMSPDPRDRWWGVEIDIPPALDRVIDLTFNKQQANILSTIMHTASQYSEGNDSDQRDLQDDLSYKNESDDLFTMVKDIYAHIRSMQRRIRAKRAQTRSGNKDEIEKKIDSGIAQEQSEGIKTQSDDDRQTKTEKERIEEIRNIYIQEGQNPEEAKEEATKLVKENKKIIFVVADLDGHNFFSVENMGGILRIKINPKHNAYKNLMLLTDSLEHKDMSNERKLELTKDGLWLLLASWARFEDQIFNEIQRQTIQEIRHDWGKELHTFLEQNAN